MNSQHQKILDILSDGDWHCTSEMRSEYMADPPKRLQELRDDKEYKFYLPRLCKRHNHRGGVKEWRLLDIRQLSEPRQTPQNASQATFQSGTMNPVFKEEILTPRGWAYYPPKFCCPIAKASDNRLHARGCEAQKAPV
jgi:hypothetical protein